MITAAAAFRRPSPPSERRQLGGERTGRFRLHIGGSRLGGSVQSKNEVVGQSAASALLSMQLGHMCLDPFDERTDFVSE
jgi:hypothetical protein